jgi:aspartyl-tRNA(Asn)/glutamyl-tRNA(Gln) amidotransferase subunit A
MDGFEPVSPSASASATAAAVRAGASHPARVLAVAGERAAAWEPWLGATVYPADRVGATAGPLAGVVAGVKELIAVAGIPRTCGAAAFLGHPTPEKSDATVVARLVKAGASLLATLASHALAYGIVTPQTRNPRAPGRIAGGSSGGSAAALAAGIVQLALGTDTGGSVRVPAACCGVVGLKTTRGLVPLTGVADLAWSLDTVGPLARSVADVELALDAIAGFDPADPESRDTPLLPPPARPVRIGVPRQLDDMPVDADVRRVWRATLDDLAAADAALVAVDVPRLVEGSDENGVVIAAEAAAVHGERFAGQAHLLPESTRVRLARGVELAASRAARARRFGALLRADLRRLFADVDVLCTPTLPCRVPTVDTDPVVVEGVDEPLVAAVTRLTGVWNLAGVPAGSVPAGRDGGGAPIGVQVVGPWFGERRVLAVLAAVERARGGPWASAPPPGDLTT